MYPEICLEKSRFQHPNYSSQKWKAKSKPKLHISSSDDENFAHINFNKSGEKNGWGLVWLRVTRFLLWVYNAVLNKTRMFDVTLWKSNLKILYFCIQNVVKYEIVDFFRKNFVSIRVTSGLGLILLKIICNIRKCVTF